MVGLSIYCSLGQVLEECLPVVFSCTCCECLRDVSIPIAAVFRCGGKFTVIEISTNKKNNYKNIIITNKILVKILIL